VASGRLHAALPKEYAQLGARLVGTSHGHGRHGFPHTAAELFAVGDPDADHPLAEDLFDLGAWDGLIEATHHRWGVWGCAYLEALLRSADGQASGEGT
jgi:CRISPR-associated endonuclease/helicase Cas3